MNTIDVLDLAEVRADLEYAALWINRPDVPCDPHALRALTAAEKLLAEVERLRGQERRRAEAIGAARRVCRTHADDPVAQQVRAVLDTALHHVGGEE